MSYTVLLNFCGNLLEFYWRSREHEYRVLSWKKSVLRLILFCDEQKLRLTICTDEPRNSQMPQKHVSMFTHYLLFLNHAWMNRSRSLFHQGSLWHSFTLGWCGRSGHLQALHDGVQVYPQGSVGLPVRAVWLATAYYGISGRAFAVVGPIVWNSRVTTYVIQTSTSPALVTCWRCFCYSLYWAH